MIKLIEILLVLEHKLATDPSAEWAATRMGSHDIECDKESCEVKSTCKRYGAEITIAGQHQLVHTKPLYLYFLRMEESLDGISINDMKIRLIQAGYNAGKIIGCFSQFTPKATDVFVNGIAGKVEGSVSFSYYPSGKGLSGTGRVSW